MLDRRAKIVCTIGPAAESPEALRELVESGMDVARLNFSHGTPEEHRERAERVRAASRAVGRPVAILQDLCGPKIRTGKVGPSFVETGKQITLIAGKDGDENTIAVDYETLAADIRVGDPILLGDGNVDLRVVEILEGTRVIAVAEHGGGVRSRMGVNLPARRVRMRALTAKDKADLVHGLDMGVDYIALSFVRSVDDVEELRQLCEQHGRPTPIISKIETPQAVEQMDAIVRVSDGVMVARGDLAVEMSPEVVPVIQRELIVACRQHQRPCIVATEMLQSMVDSPRPTRAEASDVASAVFDGADAVMLSAESATGKYPHATVRMMAKIIREAESSRFFDPQPSMPGETTAEAVAYAAKEVARTVGAKAVVAMTASGRTARLVSKARPHCPVIAFSNDDRTLARAALLWGVAPYRFEIPPEPDQQSEAARKFLVEQGFLQSGDKFVMVYGRRTGVPGTTNSLRVDQVP